MTSNTDNDLFSKTLDDLEGSLDKKIEHRMSDMSQRMGMESSTDLDSMETALDRKVEQRMDNLMGARTQPDVQIGSTVLQSQAQEAHVFRLGLLGTIQVKADHNFLGGDSIFRVPASTVKQMAAMVINSPYVQDNEQYRGIAESVNLIVMNNVPLVNAFACNESPRGYGHILPPVMVMCDGACVVTKLVSLVLGIIQPGQHEKIKSLLLPIIKDIGEIIEDNEGLFIEDDACDICNDYDIWSYMDEEARRRANSYGAAMMLAVLAHELGHIVYGHIHGKMVNEYEPDDLAVSRNQEREADSFASSIISRSPFRDYLVLGGIFWWVVLTWASDANKDIETTHPHPEERVMNFIREHRSQANALGIDEASINEFLPGKR